MLNKRSLTIFLSTFALVLVAGAAFAQVGSWEPSAPEEDTAASEPLKITTTTTDPEEVEESTTTTVADDESEKDEEGEETTPTTEPDKEPVVDTDPPDLVILWPDDSKRYETKEAVFEGWAEPGSKVSAGPYLADSDHHGNWRIVLVLSEGANEVVFTATDNAGNVTEADITVHYDKPEEKKEEPKVVNKEFSANQKWGENDQAKDLFWGTGRAGDKVWIVSEHGTTTTYVNDKGNWETWVEWHEVPNNTEIAVVIEASNGREEFSFYKIGPTEEVWEFSAHQTYGSCGEDTPYDIFYGTAEPGATVYVVSDFGEGMTTANDDGHWEIQVFFPDAPFNDTFAVVAEADGGHRKVFEFTRIEGEHEGDGEGEGEGEGA
jgi:hypothetical protein